MKLIPIDPKDLVVGKDYYDVSGENRVRMRFEGEEGGGYYFSHPEKQGYYSTDERGWTGFKGEDWDWTGVKWTILPFYEEAIEGEGEE